VSTMPLSIPAPPEGVVLNAAPSSAPDIPPPPEGYVMNAPAQPVSTALDAVQSAGSGILKGAAGLVGAPGDALDTLNSGLNRLNDWLGPKLGYSPEEIEKTKVKPGAVTNTGELVGALDKAGAIHTPETTAASSPAQSASLCPVRCSARRGRSRILLAIWPVLLSLPVSRQKGFRKFPQ
jgi:hypothetical protein